MLLWCEKFNDNFTWPRLIQWRYKIEEKRKKLNNDRTDYH